MTDRVRKYAIVAACSHFDQAAAHCVVDLASSSLGMCHREGACGGHRSLDAAVSISRAGANSPSSTDHNQRSSPQGVSFPIPLSMKDRPSCNRVDTCSGFSSVRARRITLLGVNGSRPLIARDQRVRSSFVFALALPGAGFAAGSVAGAVEQPPIG